MDVKGTAECDIIQAAMARCTLLLLQMLPLM